MKARYAFDKACRSALKDLVRATSWKKSDYFVFREQEACFFKGSLNVHVNAPRSVARIEAKPMALDPILWEILRLEDNRRMPLSFRGSGAFVCPALPFREQEVELEGDEPREVAGRFLEACEAGAALALARLRSESFTELVRQHPDQAQRGAYSIALVVSLIHDGNLAEAARVATDYASGRLNTTHDFLFHDQSFHDLALSWLRKG